MREVVGEFTGKKIGPTFFQGSKPIDGIWAMGNLIITHACMMPAGFEVMDHCMFLINFQESSMVGLAPLQVQRYSSWRLSIKVSSGAMQKYINKFEENITRHRLIEKLGILHHLHIKRKTFQYKLNKLDKQGRDIMLNTEKKCHRIKPGRIPFLPEAALWIRRTQVYRSLLRFHNRHIQNRVNLKEPLRQCGIEHCFNLKVEEILLRLQVCIQKCNYFRKNVKQYQ
jgi:hypothetical protein